VIFVEDRAFVHDAVSLGQAARANHPLIHVRVGIPVEAIGDKEVEASVVVEVFQTRRPRPIGRGY
jgi:hypothetical protein